MSYSPFWRLQLEQHRTPSQCPVRKETARDQGAEDDVLLGPTPVEWVIWTGRWLGNQYSSILSKDELIRVWSCAAAL